MAPQNRFFGWQRMLPDKRDRKYVIPPAHRVALPSSIDLDTPSPGEPFDPVADQGDLGSCGPNALQGELGFDSSVNRQNLFRASRLFLYYNTRLIMGTVGYDSGVDNRSMAKALKQYGYCDETLWPYNLNAFTTKPSAGRLRRCGPARGRNRIRVYPSRHRFDSLCARGGRHVHSWLHGLRIDAIPPGRCDRRCAHAWAPRSRCGGA